MAAAYRRERSLPRLPRSEPTGNLGPPLVLDFKSQRDDVGDAAGASVSDAAGEVALHCLAEWTQKGMSAEYAFLNPV